MSVTQLDKRIGNTNGFKKGDLPWNTGKKDALTFSSCIKCGNTFSSHKSRKKRFCSFECYKTRQVSDETRKKMSESKKGKVPKNLKEIQIIGAESRRGKPLSTEHKAMLSEIKRGENSYNWKGLTPVVMQIRSSFKYRQWRCDVFTRDNFICQECGQLGGKLNADHIKPFASIISENSLTSFNKAMECEELWNINNGRTLCVDCHRKTDTWGFRYYWNNKKILCQ